MTSSADPLPPHRPPASWRASPCLRSSGATCLNVSGPAGQHHSGYAPDRLVAPSTVRVIYQYGPVQPGKSTRGGEK